MAIVIENTLKASVKKKEKSTNKTKRDTYTWKALKRKLL